MEKLPKFEDEQLLALNLKTPQALLSYEKLYLGRQLKFLRKKLEMKQSDLAKKLKTSQSAIARMEAGKQNMTLQTMVNLSFLLEKKLIIKFA